MVTTARITAAKIIPSYLPGDANVQLSNIWTLGFFSPRHLDLFSVMSEKSCILESCWFQSGNENFGQ